MYSAKVKKRTLLIVLLLVACIIVCLLVGQSIRAGGKNLQEESAGAIRETIRTAARQCYVVEGVYPPSLEYLEENYGLQVNKADFYVTYDAFASNLPPTVVVTGRKR